MKPVSFGGLLVYFGLQICKTCRTGTGSEKFFREHYLDHHIFVSAFFP